MSSVDTSQALDRLALWLRHRSIALLSAPRYVKRGIAAVADLASCFLAVWISFVLRLGEIVPLNRPVLIFLIFELICVGVVFYASGLYAQVFRFTGPRAMRHILRSCAIIFVPTLIVFGFVSVPGVPRTLTVIFPIMLFLLVAFSRILVRYFFVEMLEIDNERLRVLIYGSGPPAQRLGRSLDHEQRYNLIGYIDCGEDLAGSRIEGIPVHGAQSLEGVLERAEIDLVLLAIPHVQRSERREIVEQLQKHSVQVKILPELDAIVSGDVAVSDLRPVEVEDLLARPAVQADSDLLSGAIRGQVVLVTGAGGSIGSELCRQVLRQAPSKLILFEMTEAALFSIEGELLALRHSTGETVEIVSELGTMVDPATVDRLFARYRPATVFHAAAYKHVPLVEHNVVAGVRNNVLGTLHCIQAALRYGASRFVLVSTDKAVRPTNVMGASKRVCELVLQALAAQAGEAMAIGMVRFGNVLGSSGSVVPLFKKQIAAGGPITLTDRSITRYFMTIPEAAELVIQAGTMARGGEVYLLDMGQPVQIYDLARSLIQLSGLSVRDADNPAGDIAIEEIGLRPGEKLYEELLIDGEARPTSHPRIFRAEEEFIAWPELEKSIDALKRAIDEGDRDRLIELLTMLVPGYNPAGAESSDTTGDRLPRALTAPH